jgi:cobalt-zinc-cadmium efflux system membrane fusion protein
MLRGQGLPVLAGVAALMVGLCLGAAAAATPEQFSGMSPSPRIAAQSRDFELVGVAQGKLLTIYLDRFIDNEPVVGATIDVETDGRHLTAGAGRQGVYQLTADWVAQIGSHPVSFAIASDQATNRLTGTLEVPPALAAPAGSGNAASPLLSLANLLAFLLGALATVGWRRRTSFAAALLATGARLSIALRASERLSWLRDFARTAPGGMRLAARPVAVSVAAAIGFVAIAAIALLLLGRTVLAHEADTSTSLADATPAAAASANDAVMTDAGPRRLLDGSVFLPKASQRLLNLRTVIARSSEVGRTVQMVGRVIADPGMSGEIHASVRGRLEPIGGAWPKIGQQVQAGDVLAWVVPVVNPIDRGIILQQLSQIDREIGLVRDRVNALGAARDDTTLRELDEARADLANLLRRREAIAAVMRDRDTLRAALVAPSTGIIAASFAVAGQVVDEQQKLFEVVDLKRLWVEAYAYDVAAMGQVLDGNARSAAGATYHLKFVSRGPQLQHQTIPLYFQLDDPGPGVSVGTLLTVLTEIAGERSGIVLPRSAVVRSTSGQEVVWQHTYPESFVPMTVRTEAIDGKSVLVSAGLAVDTRVVVDGADMLNEVR